MTKDYVTSNDVLFVEKKIKSLKYYPTPNELWKEMHGRLKNKNELWSILEYFFNDKMAALDRGKIIWLKNPKLMKLLQTRGFVVL